MAKKKVASKKVASARIGTVDRKPVRLLNPSGPVDGYSVIYSSRNGMRRIALKRGATYVASLFFYPDTVALPADALSNGQITMNYRLSDFANVLDLLRNEKPLYVWYYGANNDNGLWTGDEPVGEAE